MDRLNLLTKAEAAELLRVSVDTVERLIRGGQLPAYRIGKAVTRIDEGDVLAYLESRRMKVRSLQSRPVKMAELKRRRTAAENVSGSYPGRKVV